VLVTSGMFSTFFFLTQFLQGVLDYSALEAGFAFLPMTAVMFALGRVVPRIIGRVGNTRLLVAGLLIALIGIAWLSRLAVDTAYFPGIALPLALLGFGMGIAFAPLTAAGVAGVSPSDAGAASGLVNVAQQLGGSLGLSILITVFASASRSAAHDRPAAVPPRLQAQHELAHGVATALTGSALFLALALAVVIVVIRRPAPVELVAPAEAEASA
jgi:MFS family permease